MKKLVFFSLALLTSVSSAFADKVKIGDLYYNLFYGSNTAQVVYENHNVGYNYYSISEVTIPTTVTYENVTYTVTSIGEYAFSDCYNLISVTIGNNITTIGDGAFEFCVNLSTINIPNSVTKIGNLPFDGCSSLPVIDNLRYADTYIVEAVDHTLASYSIKSETKWIGSLAFSNCTNLTSIIIPTGVTNIEKEAFSNCKALNTISIPNTVNRIGTMAFNDCSNLSIDTIPVGVALIEGKAFYKCKNITSMMIPNTIVSIGQDAFSQCSQLKKVTLNSNAIASKTYSGQNNISHIFGSQVKEYIIGNDVTKIGAYAFSYSNISSVKIGNNVDSICNDAFNQSGLDSVDLGEHVSYIGDRAFTFCNLTSIIIPASVQNITYNSFSGCDFTKVTINSDAVVGNNRVVAGSLNYLFGYLVQEYILGNNVTSIGYEVFNGCKMTSIVLGENITSIGERAFIGCQYIKNIILPNNLQEVGINAFTWCNSLSSITIPNSVISIKEGAFLECANLSSIIIGSSVESIESSAFSNCQKLNSVTCNALVPPTMGLNEIGIKVFEGLDCSKIPLHVPLESIDLYKAADQWKEFFGSGSSESIDEIQDRNNHVRKVIHEGQVSILRGKKTYTLQGQEVK